MGNLVLTKIHEEFESLVISQGPTQHIDQNFMLIDRCASLVCLHYDSFILVLAIKMCDTLFITVCQHTRVA